MDTLRGPNLNTLECNALFERKKLAIVDYDIPCIDLAKKLLGKILVRQVGKDVIKGRIVETESYLGKDDKASHSYNGRITERNKPMFMAPGTTYVYFTYGMYHCFNISSKGEGAAVLLRALEPIEGLDLMRANRECFRRSPCDITERKPRKNNLKYQELCNGPSKLCISLNIDRECNKQDLSSWDGMWIESESEDIQDCNIVRCPRIGINSAGEETASLPLRFYILDNPCVSKRDKVKERELRLLLEKL